MTHDDAISRESSGESWEDIFLSDAEDEECCECGGDGWITDDCFEDTCCCLNPETQHGVIPCPACNPKGDQ